MLAGDEFGTTFVPTKRLPAVCREFAGNAGGDFGTHVCSDLAGPKTLKNTMETNVSGVCREFAGSLPGVCRECRGRGQKWVRNAKYVFCTHLFLNRIMVKTALGTPEDITGNPCVGRCEMLGRTRVSYVSWGLGEGCRNQ